MRIVFVAFVAAIVAIVSAVGLSPAAAASGVDFDIAPFARRCCVFDRHTSPLEFDYDEARNAGADAQQTADGRYVYGLQWTEERDISEVRFHYKRDPKVRGPVLVPELALPAAADAIRRGPGR